MLEQLHADMVAKLSKTGEELQKAIRPHQLEVWHHATGIGTEAGELLTVAKAYAIYGRDYDRENVVEEFGDLEFYLQGLRKALGITREETLQHNMEKLAKRYPNYQYSDERAIARADKAGEGPRISRREAQMSANFGDLTYHTVPIKERMVWQGSGKPHSPKLKCLCCGQKSQSSKQRINGHVFIDGRCKNCNMVRSLAALTVKCGSKAYPENQ